MGQFGDDLKREREYRGVSLDKISEATKISTRHLEALEQERFGDLPGGVFNKGIVRGYTRVIGLEEEEWVERYMSAYSESGQLKDDDAYWVRFAQNVGKSRKQEGARPDMRLRWAGVAVLLMVLAGLGWFVWHYVHERVSALERLPQPTVGLVAPSSGIPGFPVAELASTQMVALPFAATRPR